MNFSHDRLESRNLKTKRRECLWWLLKSFAGQYCSIMEQSGWLVVNWPWTWGRCDAEQEPFLTSVWECDSSTSTPNSSTPNSTGEISPLWQKIVGIFSVRVLCATKPTRPPQCLGCWICRPYSLGNRACWHRFCLATSHPTLTSFENGVALGYHPMPVVASVRDCLVDFGDKVGIWKGPAHAVRPMVGYASAVRANSVFIFILEF
jgi:hypothetical protein